MGRTTNSAISSAMKFSTVATVLLLGLLLLSCDSGTKEEKVAPPPKKTATDLTTHPIYSKYQFGPDDHTIDFGTQPLAIPTGTLAGAMQRDQVLGSLLADAGFTLKTHPFYDGEDINFFLKRSDLDLAVAGDMPTLSATAGNYAVAIALVKQNYSAIITEEITKLEDLKGKRVGYTTGSTAHYMLLEALQTVSLTDKDVTMVPLKVNEMYDALKKGDIDAFSAWEPITTIALKKSSNLKVIHRGINSSYLYCNRSFLEHHPETVKLLIASLARSLKWMTLASDNVLLASDWSMQGARDFTGKENDLTRQEYARLIDEGIVNIATSPIIPANFLKENGMIHRQFLFMQQSGKIAAEITWPEILNKFNRTMMTEVLDDPRRFRLSEYNFNQ